MAGDYEKFQHCYASKNVDKFVVAATDWTTASALAAPKSANHRLYVQKITVAITTYAAKTWTFQDSAGTVVPIAFMSIPASAPTTGADTPVIFDFGPQGIALTLGKSLMGLMSATGAAGAIHIEAYEKLEGAVAQASTN